MRAKLKLGQEFGISIHALLAESDHVGVPSGKPCQIFLSTLSLRRATGRPQRDFESLKFLSTLSLRRATKHPVMSQEFCHYFYPRSPCGERQWGGVALRCSPAISIHALLAESDRHRTMGSRATKRFLSTLSLRRATVHFFELLEHFHISIHALLAESDCTCLP